MRHAAVPRLAWRAGQRLAIALEDGDVVTVTGEKECSSEAADASADDDDDHGVLIEIKVPRCVTRSV
jgi:hypothetical protein